MSRPTKDRIVKALLERDGRTFADELGIEVAKGTPSPLFRLLCASILFSARISHELAASAMRALDENGWRTAKAMAASSWAQRRRVLNRAGYARYDESTSSMLGDTAELALERYGGDLRKLREQAERDPATERRLLKEFKGIGDVGVDIYFREAQVAWDELRPFADRRALAVAVRLGLGRDARSLARHVAERDFARLVAALVRAGLVKDLERVLDQASSR
jgi:hypothetical protein